VRDFRFDPGGRNTAFLERNNIGGMKQGVTGATAPAQEAVEVLTVEIFVRS
jgi:hypothetical protein